MRSEYTGHNIPATFENYQIFENKSNELVHVFVNGEEIITTPSHPFYVPKLGWTSAIKLRAGDILVLSNGEYVVVEAVQHEIFESPVKVYNFEVEDFHTYFVGECSVLVHNTCVTEADNKTLITGEEWYRYFQNKYGAENVSWNVNSFDDILSHPTSLSNYSADEIADVLGDGWTKGTYGSNRNGWKFIQNSHPENSVFYHGGGGVHGGSYYGVSSGKTGKIKIVDMNTYIPLPNDSATIIYNFDW